jgi:type IV pilus assembly protein PilA
MNKVRRRLIKMRLPKRGEKGFTLIELLIVVAILGVLAAVVIPNVGRFIGRGETEASETEFSNVQSAVVAMMVDNQLSTLPNPVASATSDMSAFPDATSDWNNGGKATDVNGDSFGAGDRAGFILFQHDMTGDTDNSTLVNYVATQTTKGTYTCDANGTVTQESTGY